MAYSTYKVTRSSLGPANDNAVLIALGRQGGRVPLSLAGREGEVVVASVLVQVRSLDSMVPRCVVGQVSGRAAAGAQGVGHFHLVETLPVGAELEIGGAANGDPVGVNGVVRGGRRRGDTNLAVVGPGVGFQGGGGCNSNGGIPAAQGRASIVHVVCAIYVVYVRSLRECQNCRWQG